MTDQEPKYLRWSLTYRVEHLILLISFTVLGITGLIQKYALYGVSQAIIGLLGGVDMVRIIHRFFALVLLLETVWYIGEVLYRLYVLRHRPTMLPTMGDMRAAMQSVGYNLRMSKNRPQQGRFTFEEKFEFWALVWGTVVMIVTGFVLWNPIAASNLLSGEFVPAAKEVHGGEALLAVLSIIVWHMYHVHIRRFNKSMFTGYMTEEEMLEEHPLELADMKAGLRETPVEPAVVARRQRVFIPVFGLLAAVMLAGIFFFATFEETAIATVPEPENVVIYAPLTPTPFPTALPSPTFEPVPTGAPGTGPGTWEGGIANLFKNRCGGCHGSGTQMGNLNLSSYTSALAGGTTGPGIVPGDPSASIIFTKQAEGNHPVVFTEAELSLVEQWIEAGAPEN